MIAFAILILVLQATALFFLGQPAICECGYIKIWEGVVQGSGNSQHLTDWYTPSHVIHGILFYVILWFFFPNMPAAKRFLLALGMETAWEVIENTPWVISHYREQALAQGYTGDSIINSIFDTLAMIVGFVFARKSPIWVSAVAALSLEIFVGYFIRDNLIINIVNLIHPFEFIYRWQSG